MTDLTDTSPHARWSRALEHLKSARRAACLMRNPELPGQERDEAASDYVAAADALVAELGIMAETGVLGLVGELIDVTYGRV